MGGEKDANKMNNKWRQLVEGGGGAEGGGVEVFCVEVFRERDVSSANASAFVCLGRATRWGRVWLRIV